MRHIHRDAHVHQLGQRFLGCQLRGRRAAGLELERGYKLISFLAVDKMTPQVRKAHPWCALVVE